MSSIVVSLFLQHFIQQANLEIENSVHLEQTGSGRIAVEVQAVESNSSSIPRGAQRIPMLSLQMTASCSADVFIDAIHVRRVGLGSNDDISAIYVVSDGLKLNQASVIATRDGRVQLPLRHLSLSACSSREFTIVADFSPDAAVAGEHRLILDGAKPIDTSASVTVSKSAIPLIRSTTPQSAGLVSLEYLRLNGSIRYGDNRLISRFLLHADSEQDQLIQAITFTNRGSASNGDLQNLYIESSTTGKVTSITPALEGKRVRIAFDPPLLLKRNQKRVFSLRTNVRSGVRKTIQMIVEDPSDIEATPARRTR